ncbi:hypothetical protein [Lacinutrix salivirga]
MDKENTSSLIKTILQNNNLKTEDLAKEITCSIQTLTRLISQETYPTEKFIKEIERINLNGYDDYRKISLYQKGKIPEKNGTIGGATVGTVASAVGITSIYGLSGAGISAGLTAIGGTMVAGVATIAAAPIAIGALGYGIVKGFNSYKAKKELNKVVIDTIWEYK